MSSEDAIWHVTVDGHAALTTRLASDEPVIDAMAGHLHRAVMIGRDPIPPYPGLAALMTAEGPDLLVTVYLDRADGPVPLLSFGVATQPSANAARLWGIVGGTGEPPPTPWCAAKPEIGAHDNGAELALIEDYRRCLAFAWIDRVRGVGAAES
ncbi:hypothetical protein G3545_08370 [Starkeya sp. ORNL1]|uniref:hypothetical protein n=1 Tax=Starkeya sp. ORNL1 TaxID=2709380 RepID=UPI0014638B3D|nr:hypothetical protein [Starkeya sp. ORNL1]QJP13667.1 hypothetical protein G3545_08370 [Starkeya sp. ORNL1]